MRFLERMKADANYKNLRDEFFTPEEIERFKMAMQNPLDKIIHAKLKEQRTYILYEKALKLINDVESGVYDESNLNSIKIKIAHYLAAHDDVEELEMSVSKVNVQ